MDKTYQILTLGTMLIAASCSGRKDVLPADGSASCCEDSAMAHFLAEPERSVSLLDSAVLLDRLTPQRALYLKAIVAYNGLRNPDSCMALCRQMIDEEVWTTLPTGEDPVSFQIDVYELMVTAAYSVSDLLTLQRYAKAGIELAHDRDDLRAEEAGMMGRLGAAQVATGEAEQGLSMLDEAKGLVQHVNKWPSVLSYINISKKCVQAFSLIGDYEGVCREAQEALSQLYSLRRNCSGIAGIPKSMLTDSTALEEFIHYNQAPLTAYITKAYSRMGMSDSARVWYERFIDCPQHDNPAVTGAIIDPLIAFGENDEALRRIARTKEFLAKDTLSEDFLNLLKQEQDIYLRTERRDEALALAQRIQYLTEHLNQRDYKALLANSTAQIMLQQEQLKRKVAEERLFLYSTLFLVVLSVLLMAGGAYYIRKIRRSHSHLSAELEKAQTEIKTLKENEPSQNEDKSATVRPEELYRRAQIVMENEEPFTDSKYTIDDLARQVFTNRGYLSNAINQLSGMAFRNWLAKYRVDYAKRIMLQTPDISITQLSKMCGFDSRNSFYRQFSNVEGMTPSEWLKQNVKTEENEH